MRSIAMNSQSGFTFVEIMIALGISTFVLSAILSTYYLVFRDFSRISSQIEILSDSQIIGDYFIKEIQNVGGGDISAFAAIWVEDNCLARDGLPNCNQSDRLTLTEPVMPLRECRVAATDPMDPNLFTLTTSASGCCADASWAGSAVLITRQLNFISRTVEAVDEPACLIRVRAGQAQGNDTNPVGATWVQGYMTLVRNRTFFLNLPKFELAVYEDSDGIPGASTDEIQSLAIDVYDMQVALGYDSNPENGLLIENGTTADEVRFNAPGSVETFGAAGLVFAAKELLYSVHMGFLIGGHQMAGSGLQGQSMRVLNGPLRTNTTRFLQRKTVRIIPRNRFRI